jgi:adenylosuccinate lyase
MLDAVTKGLGREDAHRIVKGHAVSALQSNEPGSGVRFIKGLAKDPSFPMNESEISAIVQREKTLISEALKQVKRVDARVKNLAKKNPYSVDFESII